MCDETLQLHTAIKTRFYQTVGCKHEPCAIASINRVGHSGPIPSLVQKAGEVNEPLFMLHLIWFLILIYPALREAEWKFRGELRWALDGPSQRTHLA